MAGHLVELKVDNRLTRFKGLSGGVFRRLAEGSAVSSPRDPKYDRPTRPRVSLEYYRWQGEHPHGQNLLPRSNSVLQRK